MRVALVVIALFACFAAGCSSSSTSSLCSNLTRSKADFSKLGDGPHEIAVLDGVLAGLSPRDRRLVAPVRDYARILYRRSDWSQARKVAFLKHFFVVDAPALDRRLRDDCGVSLDPHIAPFRASQRARS